MMGWPSGRGWGRGVDADPEAGGAGAGGVLRGASCCEVALFQVVH